MIKSISFQKEFIPLIKQGKKTVTRRVKTKLRVSNICYFKAGRIGEKEGYIKIIGIEIQPLKEGILRGGHLPNSIREMLKEGIGRTIGRYHPSYYMEKDFIELWNKLNKKGYKWEDNPEVYRIEFEYLGKELLNE